MCAFSGPAAGLRRLDVESSSSLHDQKSQRAALVLGGAHAGLHRITVSTVSRVLFSTLCWAHIITGISRVASRTSEISATTNVSIPVRPRRRRVRGCCDASHATLEARNHECVHATHLADDMSRVTFQVCLCAQARRTPAAMASASRREQRPSTLQRRVQTMLHNMLELAASFSRASRCGR